MSIGSGGAFASGSRGRALSVTPRPFRARSSSTVSTLRIFFTAMALLLLLCAGHARADGRDGAEKAGRAFEHEIQGILERAGFTVIASSDWNEATLYKTPTPRIVVTNAPYVSIYGHRARIEFLIISGQRQILCEVKHQATEGSADEKMPFIYETARANLGEREYIFVMGGDGWKPGAVTWIRRKAKKTPGFKVFNRDEFAAWVKTL